MQIERFICWYAGITNGGTAVGIPDALSREEIPLAARILRVVDSYAALTDERPFRAALSSEKAREEIVAGGRDRIRSARCKCVPIARVDA